MKRYPIVSRDRTMLYDGNMTLFQIKTDVESRGETFSIRRTLQLYGLTYVEERSFTSKYRQEFNLSKNKKMYDIRLSELVLYKDTLLGFSVVRG